MAGTVAPLLASGHAEGAVITTRGGSAKAEGQAVAAEIILEQYINDITFLLHFLVNVRGEQACGIGAIDQKFGGTV